MEHIKGSLGSQQQQNQSKKKSKNKKKSSKSETVAAATTTRSLEETQTHEEGVALMVENGLTDQLKQQLHIGKEPANAANSTSCSTNNSNNNNKVNGLMTENLKTTKACPPTTITSKNSLSNDQKQPALNGHHHEDKEECNVNGEACNSNQAMAKKSKRKPNNKKNNSLDRAENDKLMENGHCSETDATKSTTTNGFSHSETQSLAKETNHNTAMTNTPTTKTTSSTVTSCKATDCKQQPLTNAEKSSENNTPIVALSKTPNEAATNELDLTNVHIEYKEYESELQMHDIMRLIQAELSEPYSIYTYRYFIYNWPQLCFLAAHGNEYVGAIVCKLDMHMNVKRGYIAMLAVRKEYRKLKIGTTLVQKAIEAMLADKADEVVLETEMSNLPALRLYENLGFVRDKRLFRYYLNGVDALRLKLWFR